MKYKSNPDEQISDAKYLQDPTMILRDIFRAVLAFKHLL